MAPSNFPELSDGPKRVLVLPSWYPTADTPLHGTFVQEQALLMSRWFDTKVLLSESVMLSGIRASMSRIRRATGHPLPPRDVTPLMEAPPDGIFFRYDVSRHLSEEKTLEEAVLYYEDQVESLIQRGWTPDLFHAHSVI